MNMAVGEVVAVRGIQVTLRIFEESNLETLFFDGKKYKGVSIREYIGIKRGFFIIVCLIEGEYLDETRFEFEAEKKQYIRKVEAKPIGYFDNQKFNDGIKIMPMIKDCAVLLNETQVLQIFSREQDGNFAIGKLLKENTPLSLPWHNLFNSHIGIFGNTGSGKSNTLTRLYLELFTKYKNKLIDASKFILVDFSGEYTGKQILDDADNKKVYNLTTGKKEGDKFPLPDTQLWNTENLCLLFQATAFTQTPFLNRVVSKRFKYASSPSSIKNYVISTFRMCFVSTYQNREFLTYLKAISKHLKFDILTDKLDRIFWFDNKGKYACKTNSPTQWEWFESDDDFNTNLLPILEELDSSSLDPFDELVIRINIQLLRDLNYGYVQFDHIQPLLKRMEASIEDLRKIFVIKQESESELNLLNVISLRNCNQTMKKIVPLLLAKLFYQSHKESASNPPRKTLHFIIDEAHNVLSQQSNREHESWKDYRLELFEEIIKEGRKYGIFLTLSSQRPADISPTIMSQIHNFFIHRLVNEKDLFLIENTISTLDKISRSIIPTLSIGCCIVTGTAFNFPLIMQVDPIMIKESRPDSDDVNLKAIWGVESTSVQNKGNDA